MDDLISIIVPVYNVESFLKECLNSILSQTYKNFEVLLIDDGSTDNSGKICDDYVKNDSRVQVIHKKNEGVSMARNTGLEIAHGNYIAFIDSDDFVCKDYLEFLYKGMIESNKDISICGIWQYYEDSSNKLSTISNIKMTMDKSETNKWLYIIGYYDTGLWNKLFKRHLFENVRFPKNKKSEDIFVLYKLIENSNGAFYNSDPKYYYRQRNNSITKSSNINYDVVEATKNAIVFYEKHKYYDVLPYAYRYLIFSYIGIYNACLCRTKNMNEAKRVRKECLTYNNKINYKFLNKSRLIQIILFFYFISFYNILFKFYFKKQRFF